VSFVEDGLPNKYCNFLREHGFKMPYVGFVEICIISKSKSKFLYLANLLASQRHAVVDKRLRWLRS